MTNNPLKAAVIDTGVVIEFLTIDSEDNNQKKYNRYLNEEIFQNSNFDRLFVSFLTKTELLYITCRTKGWLKAKEYIDEVLKNFFVIRNEELDELAAMIKCSITISLSDCFCLAVGSLYDIPVYFMEEFELTKKTIKQIRDVMKIELHIMKKQIV